MGRSRLTLAAVSACLAFGADAAEVRVFEGHGGPVHDVAMSPDGRTLLTGSFDNALGLWSIEGDLIRWLDGHEAAIKTVLWIAPDKVVSAGDDFAIRLWNTGSGLTERILEGHRGQVASLALAPDGSTLASASWDGTIGLWDVANGLSLGMLEGHEGAVNDVAFLSDATLLSASADGTIRSWDVAEGVETRILTRHGFGVTQLLPGDGWLAYGAVDGGTRVIDIETAETLADLTLDRRPILAMALRPDGGEIAVGDGQGFVMRVVTDGWSLAGDWKAAAYGPVWALSYTADGSGLVAGGIDDAVVMVPADHDLDRPIMALDEPDFHGDPATMSNGERQFRRKCSICHTLTGEGDRRAGPTLAGIFGRAAGSLPGYTYSDTVAALDFNWDETTIDRLFDLGPDHFIPGSKMPMQRIADPDDRRDLIEFLRNNT